MGIYRGYKGSFQEGAFKMFTISGFHMLRPQEFGF